MQIPTAVARRNLAIALLALLCLCPGATAQGSISGRLFFDENQDAVENGLDYPLAAITVSLLDPGVDGYVGTLDDTIVASTQSNLLGDYTFVGVAAGRYFVDVDELDPDMPTTQYGPNLTTGNDPQELIVDQGVATASPVGWVIGAKRCFAVADAGDALHQMDRLDGTNGTIGPCGVPDIEATAIQPGTTVLYAADADILGIVNRVTGAFTTVGGNFGTANGLVGGVATNVNLTDVDGLAFDPDPLSATNGVLFGTHRRGAAPDLLFQIDHTTGAFIPGVFPGGFDFAEVIGAGIQGDIDDIAIDIVGGQMYGVANTGGGTDDLILIDKTTGAGSVVGGFDLNGSGTLINDMEGLGFAVDGFFYGTTGSASTDANHRNRMWFIETATGFTTLVGQFATDGDYESMDCLVYGLENEISGTVFLDNDSDAFYGAGDAGFAGAVVRLFLDTNANGQVDGGEPLVATQSTDTLGYYSFLVGRRGPFVLEVDPTTLPAGHIFTTDNVEVALFNGFGLADRNNNFGFQYANPSPLQITKGSDVAAGAAVSLGQVITYTIVVSNPTGTPQTNVGVTDVLPAGTTYLPGSSMLTPPPTPVSGTYADNFSSGTFTGSTGSLTWPAATPWSEDGTDDGVAGSGVITLNNRIQIGNPAGVERRLFRQVNLSGATTATLSYDFTGNGGGTNGDILVEARSNSSAAWVLVRTLNTATSQSPTDNLLALITGSATSQIRYRRAVGAGTKNMRVDNVLINYTGVTSASPVAASPPPILVPPAMGITLPAMSMMTVTFQVTVDDPLDSALTSIDNTASAFSTQNPVPVSDDHSDPLVARLGDFVWNDLDADGLVGPGEAGLGGVTVNLYAPGIDGILGTMDDILVGTQVTSMSGGYFFTDLVPGAYRVDLDTSTLPMGTWRLTTGNEPLDVTLASGEHYTEADFGYQEVGSIGDVVWLDLDGDGAQSAAEPGIASVPVTLYGPGPDGLLGTADDIALETQLTDGFGGYDFLLLRAGDYRVEVDESSAPLLGLGITTGNNPYDHALSPSEDRDDADFGYRFDTLDGTIGDFVWNDLNADGVQDGGEPGIPGVTIGLYEAGPDGLLGSADDVLVATRVTDGMGAYDFGGVPAGNYLVDVDNASAALAGLVTTTGNDPVVVVLSVGEDFNLADFGYAADPGSAAIGDFVWQDTNADGVQDVGEPGIDGVSIDLTEAGPDGLFNTGDDVAIASMVTAGGGAYDFTGLPAGLYRVDVNAATLPAGFGLTTGNVPLVVSLAAAEDFNAADFGYVTDPGGSIGDLVWGDENSDRLFGGAESGLAGVTVDLITAGPDGFFGTGDDVVAATMTTDGNGFYAFLGLPAGRYLIDIDEGTLPPAAMTLTTGNEPLVVHLSVGEAFLDADFGYNDPSTGSIGDFVWFDTNGDGIQDAGELGLGGVTVTLFGAGADGLLGTPDDVTLATQVTDAFGGYGFTGLSAGDYRVDVDGTSPALVGLGGTTGNDALNLSLASGQVFTDADFGYRVETFTASIGDFVWNDTNGDGIQDVGEMGLPGVDLVLTEAGDDGIFGTADDVMVGTATTDGMGAYLFAMLPAGTYRIDVVEATLPPGLTVTTGNEPLDFILSVAESFDTADFGYRTDPVSASIGDFVWNDTDGDGIQDVGEPGIPGVSVNLLEAGPDGLVGTGDDVFIGVMVTDGTGAYDFLGLPAGLYLVDVDGATLPAGLGSTTGNEPLVVALAGGEDFNAADFGYAPDSGDGSIGDLIWNDENGNGLFDGLETGIAGVTVNLVGAGPDGLLGTMDDVFVDSTVTDGSGNYDFPGLDAGNYRVDVDEATLPPNLLLTTGNEPLDVALVVSEDFDLADFGYGDPESGSIGDFVWNDANGDGIQDAGELGIPNVTVRLLLRGLDGVFGTADDLVLDTQMTNAFGAYQFTGLPAGEYRVDVVDATVPVGLGITTGNDPLHVSLAAAQDFGDADFGYTTETLTASIGDFVWEDANGDGIQDGGEVGIAGVTVNLVVAGPDGVFGTGDDVIAATTVTDGMGLYQFTGVPAGNYLVDVDEATLPGGFTETSVEPLAVNLSVGEVFNDADFGYQTDPMIGSIGDLVWGDVNGNGILDGAEVGLPGVTVNLTEAGPDGILGTGDDVFVGSMVTDGAGAFDFTGLPAGLYQVNVDAATLPAGLGLTTGNEPLVVALAGGENFDDADFGYRTETLLGSIGDYVWNDDDGDGIQDPSELPLVAVQVLLIGAGPDGMLGTGDDIGIGVTATDSLGSYMFLELPAGLYRVDVIEATLPAGSILTTGNEPFDILLSTGEARSDADFGYDNAPGSIGDFVYHDIDGNGIQDAGEPGIASVIVTLFRPGADGVFGTPDDIQVGTQLSDGNGFYDFVGLPPGDYRVVVDEGSAPLVGFGNTTGNNPYDHTLAQGEDHNSADFGYIADPGTGSIGDFVWNDLNADGVQDGGESGIPGVTIGLYEAGPDGFFGTGDDVLVATEVTDGMGAYLFNGLPAGNYLVDVDDASAALAGLVTTTGNDPLVVMLSVAEGLLDADFGYVADPVTASIGDFIWNDTNANGIQDFGELAIAGVSVELFAAGPDGIIGTGDDISLGTQVTDASGFYDFTGLAAGLYRVDVDGATLPAGFGLTTGNEPDDVILVAGEDYDLADFGYREDLNGGQIGNLVWADTNGDGIRDAGENGLAGVTVDLVDAGPDGIFGNGDDVIVATTVTDGAGAYEFLGLPAGDYLIDIDEGTLPPATMTLTTGNEPLVVHLSVGEAFLDADFGYNDPSTGSIGDFVWFDTNGDGIQDAGELGLGGVTVTLFGAGADGVLGTPDDVTLATQVTDAFGGYGFTGLSAGDYRVDVDGTSPALVGLGGTTGNDALNVNLASGQVFTDADFGYRVETFTSSIGDFVWDDTNGDGIQDVGEMGLPGVDLVLTEAGDDGIFGTADDVMVGTTTTDGMGAYLFAMLPAGTYRIDVVEATLPAGLTVTTGNEPLDFILSVAESFDTADFGYRTDPLTASIGDFVWDDTDGDGIQDVGEPGLPGVTVTLTEAGPDGLLGTVDDVFVGVMVTDGFGAYSFTGLPAGLYLVDVDEASLPAGLGSTTGNEPLVVALAGAEDFDAADFGYAPDPATGLIGDLVWSDTNADGIRDVGEVGIAGVIVNLIDAGPDGLLGTGDDFVTASTVTDGLGAYTFGGLPAGNYLVDVDEGTLPPNLLLTTGNEPQQVALAIGEQARDADFGYGDPETGAIGDFVWNDVNGDGIQDAGELGLSGVTVRLFSPGLDGLLGTLDDLNVATQMTDAFGGYDFTGLASGDYRVDIDEATLPLGFGITTGNEPDDLTLVAGQDYDNADFGYVLDTQTGVIGDFVWNDLDGDGIQDGGAETGIAGVTVNLVVAGADGILGTGDDVIAATTVTDGMGMYQFTGVPAGNYLVDIDEATLPGGFIETTVEPLVVNLSVGESFDAADFGYQMDPMTSSIGDLVWNDLNDNGVRDFGELGISGVTVNLIEAGPDGILGTGDDVFVGSMVTDVSGAFDFTGLPAGLYEVDVDGVTLPGGLALTTGNEPLVVMLAGGEDFDAADFGYRADPLTGFIGDYVWRDDDGDGIQDAGELPLESVQLQLFEAGPDGLLGTGDDVPVGLTATDAAGNYMFVDLAAGLYRVDVLEGTLPAGLFLTTGNEPFDVLLSAAEVRTDVDFGYDVAPGSIGDFVWHDIDGNGIQDAGEPGVASVTVRLFGAGADGVFGTPDDTVFGIQITDGSGGYDFTGLVAGDYRVVVDEASAPLVGFGITTGNNPYDHALAQGEDHNGADFGYIADPGTGSIGDFVWDDTNSDGVQDGGEPGIPGVTIELYEAGPDGFFGTGDDVLVATQVTDGMGAYLFTGLPAGNYLVDVDEGTLPGGGAGLVETTGSEPLLVGLSVGTTFLTADFGYGSDPMTASIGDLVWNDANANGIQDFGELALAGVTVELFAAGPDGLVGTLDDISLGTQVTDASGFYDFTGLAAGLYRVDVDEGTLPAGFGLTTGNEPDDVMLAVGEDYGLADFGYREDTSDGSIGDLVWNDQNGDGLKDPTELGLAGVTVDLVDAGPDGIFGNGDDVIVATTVTDGTGAYEFLGLPAGDYLIDIDEGTLPPAAMTLTTGNEPLVVHLSVGEAFLDADFGYNDPSTGSIGDFVWFDTNGDGIQDAGELGLGGVTVTLFGAGADGVLGTPDDVTLATQVTDAFGGYGFTGLSAGDYRVDVDGTSPALVGLGGTTGNDALNVNLASGQVFTDADFGYRVETFTSSIGDFVWDDTNGDGIQDVGEMGLPGVDLVLTEAGDDGIFGTADDVMVGTTTTDGMGAYLFAMLPAGTYRIDVVEATLPAGLTVTTGNEPLDFILSVAESFDTADFGYRTDPLTASIGDFVWDDTDGDGIQDVGEPGLPGVTVTLTEAGPDGLLGTVDDVFVGVMVTDGFGAYSFTGLPAGLYLVDVDEASLPAGLGSTTGNEPLVVALAGAEDFDAADFGYAPDPATGLIGDLVWSDTNADGIRDVGEVGIAGVIVNLIDAGPDGLLGTGDDFVTASTVTDGLGAYTFGGLPAGNYLVDVDEGTLPPNLLLTTGNEPQQVALAIGEQARDADFGYGDPETGAIGDFVWNDVNGDGIQDAGELGLSGVTVRLFSPGLDGLLGTLDDLNVATQMTDAFGGYDFTGLASGDYRVDIDEATLPLGFGITTGNEPDDLTLVAGQDYDNADFGYVLDTQTGVIGDFVWNDLDGDGIQDGGAETGIAGVTVNLVVAGADGILGTGDDVIAATTVTDGMGMYQFTGVPAGNYLVDIDEATLPGGFIETTVEPLVVNLSVGESFDAADFGYQMDPMTSSIGDLVWNDLNDNGVRDFGELGISGVTVNLIEAGPDGILGTGDDVFVGSMVTDVSGAFDFTGLPAGLYEVDVDGVTLPGGLALTTGNEPLVVMLAGGEDFDAADFGYRADPLTGFIGDYVWRDDDGDGIQDAGELPLESVQLQLFEAGPDGLLGTGDDVPVGLTATDAAGNYMFVDLAAGLYRVDVLEGTLPAGLFLTTGNEPFDVLLSAAEVRTDVDFGYDVAPGSIGDFVWHDIDGNGIQDAGEPGVASVTVRLFGAGADGVFGTPDDTVFGIQITDGSGGYDFTGLVAGDYRVVVDEASAPLVGFGITTGNNPYDHALAQGEDHNGADFGYIADPGTGSIGDFVWDDTNSDGVQDGGEPGIPGVTIELYEAGPDGFFGTGDDVLVATQVTDGMGAYLFTGLPAGNYLVDVDEGTLPGGGAGLVETTGSEPLLVGLSVGTTFLTADFGYGSDPMTASIGDLVWNDANANGIQDFGELALAGVTVELFAAGPDGLVGTLDDISLGTQVTDASGFYDFTGLAAGLYRVDVDEGTLPAGFGLTTGNEPDDVMLAVGEDYGLADFGYREDTSDGSIGDLVWNDQNGDGLKDPTELGLAGVTVDLVDAGPDGIFGNGDDVIVATTVTDGAGAYEFLGLPAGDYLIDIDEGTLPPAAMTLTTGNEPLVVHLSVGEAFDLADFGYNDPSTGSIGDFVWFDTNGDGVFDAGEPPIPGVTILLRGPGSDGVLGTPDDTLVGTLVTDITGAYDFTGLAAGEYRVDVDGTSPALVGLGLTTGNDALNVTLASGQALTDADFGYTTETFTASIGDFVWNDTNGDGIQDIGEMGLPGVDLVLTEAGDDGIFGTADDVMAGFTTTDGMGAYLFAMLPAGTYRIDVVEATLPAGLTITTGNEPLDLILSVAESFDTADFGYRTDPASASIGDFVWNDTDGDGIQDVGEPGIPGVSVNLLEAGPDGLLDTGDDVFLGVMVTDGAGAYDFTGLPAGLYRVDVDEATLPAGLGSTTGNEPLVVALAGGEDFSAADFGYAPDPASGLIGDLVWNDTSADGIRDVGEGGIAGVIVNLIDAGPDGLLGTGDDFVTASTVTDGLGAYTFGGLPAGNYLVDVDEATLPPNLLLTTSNEPKPVALTIGEQYRNADFGYGDPVTGSIGDFVWNDLNGDGIQDVGEPGIASVTVRLLTAGVDGVFGTVDDVIASTLLTDGSGGFDFTGLSGGDYLVDVVGTSPPLAGLGITTGNDPLIVALGAGGDFNDADFGYVTDPQTASIGDFVWNDLDGDGVQDGGAETGIAGVTVNLVVAGADGVFGTGDDIIAATTVTDGMGLYQFTGIAAGNYQVDVDEATLPGGFIETTVEPLVVGLSVGESFADADFGYQADPMTSSIGDLVWNDGNGNGIRDFEPGIPGVTVNLTEAGPDGIFGTGDDFFVGSMVTDTSGAFDFTGLPAGLYEVNVDEASLPAGLGLTTGNEPLVVALSGGEDFDDADFGYRDDPRSGSIGDLVWDDFDRDGFRDPGEPPLVGILLRLWGAGADGVLGTGDDVSLGITATDGSGLYVFLGLPAASYRVDVVEASLPPNYVLTTGNEPYVVDLAVAEVFLAADFGYHDSRRASFGDTVYYDTDGDGIQDAGENGIANVVVELYRAGVPTGMTRVTGGSGDYLFDFLPAADYTVVVLAQNFTAGGALESMSSTTGGEVHGPQTVLSGQAYLNADFGYRALGFSIGDFVWSDASNDGIQDPGEVGIAGVTLDLYQQGGMAPFASTTTNAAGGYLFASLPAGVYFVHVPASNFLPGAPLDGYVFTVGPQTMGANESGNFGIDAMRPSVDVVDFGYFQAGLGSIGDTVFFDRDLDGVQGGGEPGLAGVTLGLILDLDGNGVADAGEPIVASTITDPSGTYGFSGLTAGDYVVRVTDTGGVLSVFMPTTGNEPLAVTLAAGQSFVDADFGYGAVGIGDFLWFDVNGDGVQGAGETGISGVELELFSDEDGDGIIDPEDSLLRTTVTGFGGFYLFDRMVDGDYIVSVPAAELAVGAPLAGMLPSPAGVGGDVTADSNGALDGFGNVTAAVTLFGGVDLDVDFAFNASGGVSIGDFVWLDLNSDGVQDIGEPGIENVTLQLFRDLDGDGILDPEDVQLAATQTSTGGIYGFSGLPVGDYILVITDDFGILTGLDQTFGAPVTPIANLVASRTDLDFGFADERPLYAVLASVGGVHDGSDALVVWETASEVDTAGFFLYRQDGPESWTRVNPGMIPAIGGGLAGASYWCVDPAGGLGGFQTYKLEEVEVDGRRRFFGAFTTHFPPVVSFLRGAGQFGGALHVGTPAGPATHLDNAAAAAARRARTGERLKISVSRDGIYRLSAGEIAGRMAADLQHVRLWIAMGALRLENRGRQVPYLPDFGADSLAFYGTALGDKSTYGDTNIYWLSFGGAPLMAEDLGFGPAYVPAGGSFESVSHSEQSTYFQAPVHRSVDPLLDYWFWDLVVAGVPAMEEKPFPVELHDLAHSGELANLYVLLKGSGPGPHHVVLSVGGTVVGETTWVGERVHEFGTLMPSYLLVEGSNDVFVRAVLDRPDFDIVFVDSIDITYERELRARNGSLEVAGTSPGPVTIQGFGDPQIDVYDITRTGAPRRLATTLSIDGSGYSITFESEGASHCYLAVTPAAELAPDAVWADSPSSLLDPSNQADYLVIAPAELLAPATRLAAYRATCGHETMVVELEDICDELRHGLLDPSAIGDLLSYARDRWQLAPRYVVLAGDGHYDYRDYLGHGGNLMPPVLVATPYGLYPSDSVLAGRGKPVSADRSVVIGRIPATSAAEMDALVSKIITYESTPAGAWSSRAVLVADDADEGGSYSAFSEEVAAHLPFGFTAARVYLDTSTPAAARQLLADQLASGAGILNYIGHGGLLQLADENLLNVAAVPSLPRTDQLPVLTGVSCLLGHFAVPGFSSVGEALVAHPEGGVIAAWIPASLTLNSQGRILDKAFLQARGGTNILGEMIRKATAVFHREGSSPHILETTILLGDPALQLR